MPQIGGHWGRGRGRAEGRQSCYFFPPSFCALGANHRARTQELHPQFAAFPTYPLILPFKHTDQEVIDFLARSSAVPIPGVPNFDQKRGVDGERKIEILKPLPVTSAGRTFEIRQKVLGVYDKGKPGTVIETETLLVEKNTGDVYSRVIGSGFMVGQGNWGGPKGEFYMLLPSLQSQVLIGDTRSQDRQLPAARGQEA